MKDFEALKALVKNVARTGILDTSEKAIVDYQDMIGHSTLEELHAIANSENGEEKRAFYRVYAEAAGVINAIKYYRDNSNFIQEKLFDQYQQGFDDGKATQKRLDEIDAKVALDEKQAQVEFWQAEAKQNRDEADLYKDSADENRREATRQAKEIEALQAEIIRLKAKLFDLMEK